MSPADPLCQADAHIPFYLTSHRERRPTHRSPDPQPTPGTPEGNPVLLTL